MVMVSGGGRVWEVGGLAASWGLGVGVYGGWSLGVSVFIPLVW